MCAWHTLLLCLLPQMGLGGGRPVYVNLNAFLILHFLWLGQSYMHAQKCPTGFTLSPDGAALCSGTTVPYQLHTFCRWSSPLQHSSTLLYLLDQFAGAKALCVHLSSCWSSGDPLGTAAGSWWLTEGAQCRGHPGAGTLCSRCACCVRSGSGAGSSEWEALTE